MAAAKILVVDDDAWILRMVTMVLEKKGYAITTAGDGNEAYDRAVADPPDLIITDVMMPNADGWALVKKLRTRPEFAFVPVIFLTALGSDEDRIKGFRMGADDYIPKPFRFEELDLRVARCLKARDKVRSKTAEQVAQMPDTATPSMQGNLKDLGLPSVFTVLELERKSGTLLVEGPGEKGRFLLKDGRIYSGKTEGSKESLSNADAVYAALTWGEGSFEFRAGDISEEDEIGVPTTQLLMEGARRIDETARFG